MENQFNIEFDKVTLSRQPKETGHARQILDLTELNELKKICSTKQRELVGYESQITKLRESNRFLKSALIKALIEKEELQTRKDALAANIERVNKESLELMDNNRYLNSIEGDIESMCQRFSSENQLKLLSKIKEAERKLIKLGLQPRFCG